MAFSSSSFFDEDIETIDPPPIIGITGHTSREVFMDRTIGGGAPLILPQPDQHMFPSTRPQPFAQSTVPEPAPPSSFPTHSQTQFDSYAPPPSYIPGQRPTPDDLNSCSNYLIHVGEPVMRDVDMLRLKSYVEYKINTRTTKNETFTAIRRFSDFKWLYDSIMARYPGFFLPPLPDASVFGSTSGRFHPEFIEKRRQGLERFLNRLAADPVLEESHELNVFLRLDKEVFELEKQRRQETATAAKSGGGFFGMFRTLGQSISSLGQTVSNVFVGQPANVPDDKRMERHKNYVDGLSMELRKISSAMSGVVNARKELAARYRDLGDALQTLGSLDKNCQLGSALSYTGIGVVQNAELIEAQSREEALQVEERLQDLVSVVESCKEGLKQGAATLATWQVAQATLDRESEKLRRLAEKRSIEEPVVAESVRQLEAVLGRDREQHSRVSDTINGQMRKLHKSKLRDLREIFLEFLQLQRTRTNQIDARWQDLYLCIERLDSSALPPE
eukprot:gnl/Spiro4/12258_TR6468_c0_g2_i1.p1 gnl/Spiro4/12258_TR6468_c0_g2~~gnl/Spiro4/12258_TR6468_c0_g2_i1.p1  ORF type:complete len:503 (-),score=87.34 gnl/Spiro4/12258_TR6468_c0_g2_i1:89-1597(-)